MAGFREHRAFLLLDVVHHLLAEHPDLGDELFDAKVKVLGEQVMHHVEEEEGETFPKVRSSKLDLMELGMQMAQRKEEVTLPKA